MQPPIHSTYKLRSLHPGKFKLGITHLIRFTYQMRKSVYRYWMILMPWIDTLSRSDNYYCDCYCVVSHKLTHSQNNCCACPINKLWILFNIFQIWVFIGLALCWCNFTTMILIIKCTMSIAVSCMSSYFKALDKLNKTKWGMEKENWICVYRCDFISPNFRLASVSTFVPRYPTWCG